MPISRKLKRIRAGKKSHRRLRKISRKVGGMIYDSYFINSVILAAKNAAKHKLHNSRDRKRHLRVSVAAKKFIELYKLLLEKKKELSEAQESYIDSFQQIVNNEDEWKQTINIKQFKDEVNWITKNLVNLVNLEKQGLDPENWLKELKSKLIFRKDEKKDIDKLKSKISPRFYKFWRTPLQYHDYKFWDESEDYGEPNSWQNKVTLIKNNLKILKSDYNSLKEASKKVIKAMNNIISILKKCIKLESSLSNDDSGGGDAADTADSAADAPLAPPSPVLESQAGEPGDGAKGDDADDIFGDSDDDDSGFVADPAGAASSSAGDDYNISIY